MNASKTTLKATNLAVGYTSKNEVKTIASGIDFELHKGELIGIVGANGIGKSTLLKSICGIIHPIAGQIQINHTSIANYSPLALSKELSIVLTGNIPPSNLSVTEIIALGRQPYTSWIGTLTKEDKDKVSEVLRILKLEKLQDAKSHELSDGQLQKVLIGRALAQDTSIIVLDEPTTHLDIYHKAYILKLLKEIAHTTQKTILFSTHEIELAIQLCDKMMVLTPEHFECNDPCQLIMNQSFNQLFPKDLIEFDATSGSFKVKK